MHHGVLSGGPDRSTVPTPLLWDAAGAVRMPVRAALRTRPGGSTCQRIWWIIGGLLAEAVLALTDV